MYKDWSIDKNSKTPIYLQIYNRLKKLITDKTLKVGEKLSQRQTAKIFKVSKMPVAEAFSMLEAEGFITTKPQAGTVVSNNVWAALHSDRPSFWQTYISSGRQKDMPSGLLNIFKKLENSNRILADSIAPAFKPETPIIKAMESASERLAATNDIGEFNCSGITSLKNTLVSHLKKYGIKTTVNNIIVTPGIGESLMTIALGLIGSGMNFIYETPSFVNTIMLFQSTGANMEEIPMEEEGVNIEKLTAKLGRIKNSIFYTQPVNHNPTGIHISKNKRNAILAACNKLEVPIIENDMFRDFVFDKEYPRPMKAFDRNEQVIYVGSLWSGFMGFKTSWIVAPEFIIEKLKYVRVSFELVSNTLVEIITDEMLSKGYYYEYMEKLKPVITAQYYEIQRLMDRYLSDIATWRRNSPAYFIYIKFNKNIDVVKLHQIAEDNLFFQGNMFELHDRCHARLNTIGVQPDQLEEWIKKIRNMAIEFPSPLTNSC